MMMLLILLAVVLFGILFGVLFGVCGYGKAGLFIGLTPIAILTALFIISAATMQR